jgi:hypothetical protein
MAAVGWLIKDHRVRSLPLLSPHVVLKEILAKPRPEPEREPLPADGITSRREGAGIADANETLPRPANGAS